MNFFSEISILLDSEEQIRELELIAKYKKSQNTSIVGQLYEGYMPLIYGVCLKYLRDSHDADDALMSIYEVITRKLLTNEVQAFRPWLYVVAKNYCFDQLRKKNRAYQRKSEAEIMYSEQVYHPDTVQDDKQVRLRQCIEKLKEDQKLIIHAFYFDKLSYKKIAETHQIEWGKVRNLIQNGRRMLRNCMENYEVK